MPDRSGWQSSARHASLLAFSCISVLVACGGVAVVDPEGNEASGGFAQVSSVTSSVVSTTSVGAGGVGGEGGGRGGAPPIPPLVEHPQGEQSLGVPFTFEVEAGTLGVTLIADAPTDQQQIGFASVQAPNSAAIVQNHGISTTAQYYMWPDIDTLLLPQSDHAEVMPLAAGTWTFTLGGMGTQTADVSIWTRHTLDGQFHGGLIDVNVFIAANAAGEQYMTQVITDALDGFADLSVGTITFHTLPSQYAVITDSTWLDPHLETVAASGKPALNVMVVSMIDFQNSGAIGYSAGIPGSSLVHGTRQSGVVMMPIDPSYDAYTLRHEVGHYAGLLHTSETQPGLGDRLSDTPKCDDVDQQLQGCPDFNYLMFPYANPGGQAQVSPKQNTIVQASALYRGAVEEGGGYADPLDEMDNVAGGGDKSLQALTERELADSIGVSMTLTKADATTPWRVAAGETVAGFASSIWCGSGASRDHRAKLLSMASVAELLALASDADAPDFVRMRALSALGQAQLSLAQQNEVADLATDAKLPRLVRIGAWQGLRSAAPARAQSIAPKLRLDGDRVIRSVAKPR